ncbi:MAG: hypothetical protein KDD48_05445 [Bdellovibrionales bacterium]|nr:hypothetical protein [Bdellovibrionales bacterium]
MKYFWLLLPILAELGTSRRNNPLKWLFVVLCIMGLLMAILPMAMVGVGLILWPLFDVIRLSFGPYVASVMVGLTLCVSTLLMFMGAKKYVQKR